MVDSIVNFVVDQVFGNVLAAVPLPVQVIVYMVLGGVGIFVGRKFIFMNLIMRFFPEVFVKIMRDLGKKANTFFEDKKLKGKFKGSWVIAEKKLAEGLDAFSEEIKKS